MRQNFLMSLAGAALLTASCATPMDSGEAAEDTRAALEAAVAAPSRTAANVARDRYRHPVETLSFFGIKPHDTVVEIWPSTGWYTQILAPYLLNAGTFYAATPAGGPTERFQAFLATNPGVYGKVRVSTFPFRGTGTKVPDGVADAVLTFRNVHNWVMGDPPYAEEAFAQLYAMLKPGGTLGITDHRLPETADPARERTSGYLKVSTVRRLAEQAGFKFVAASEVNANPRDTTDWPEGVWTLPPTLRRGDAERATYLAIGESDRMTLKFVKPGR